MVVKDLQHGESKAVYRNMNLDLRQYKHMQMFVHANHLVPDATQLQNGQLAVFVRMGSDYKNNYYEYEIPFSSPLTVAIIVSMPRPIAVWCGPKRTCWISILMCLPN